MATALRLKATVLTADRPWLAVAAELSLSIACIRPDSHYTKQILNLLTYQ